MPMFGAFPATTVKTYAYRDERQELLFTETNTDNKIFKATIGGIPVLHPRLEMLQQAYPSFYLTCSSNPSQQSSYQTLEISFVVHSTHIQATKQGSTLSSLLAELYENRAFNDVHSLTTNFINTQFADFSARVTGENNTQNRSACSAEKPSSHYAF